MQLQERFEDDEIPIGIEVEIRSMLKMLFKSEQFKKESIESEEIDLPQQKHRNMLTVFVGKINRVEFQ